MSTAAGGLAGLGFFSQRARNSATNAVGSISSCWTCALRQYVAKKFDSDGSYEVEEPTKKNCLSAKRQPSVARHTQEKPPDPVGNLAANEQHRLMPQLISKPVGKTRLVPEQRVKPLQPVLLVDRILASGGGLTKQTQNDGIGCRRLWLI